MNTTSRSVALVVAVVSFLAAATPAAAMVEDDLLAIISVTAFPYERAEAVLVSSPNRPRADPLRDEIQDLRRHRPFDRDVFLHAAGLGPLEEVVVAGEDVDGGVVVAGLREAGAEAAAFLIRGGLRSLLRVAPATQ